MNENEFRIKIKLNMIAFLIATAGTLCFPQILNLKENTLGFTNSIFSVFVWLLCLYAVNLSLHTIDLRDARGWTIAGILSFLFTTAMLFGVQLENAENVNFKDWKLWISLPVLTCLFTILVRKFWNFLGGMEEWKKKVAANIKLPNSPVKNERGKDILIFFFFLLCWLPVLLAVYPGFFVYDAQDEYLQVASRNFTTHHPLVHVLMLGGIICAVHKVTDSYNLGIVCYMIVQMVIVSGGFTYLLSYLRRKKVSKGLRIIAMLYFAFFPVIVMFTLCSAKDTIFTVALLLLMVSLLEMGMDQESFFASKKKMAFFLLCALTMMLFRKNGIYAFAVMAVVLICYYKKYWKKMVLLLLIAFLSYFAVSGTLTTVLRAQNEENQEILTVPIQQLTRTYKYSKEVFSEEDIATLHEILPEEALNLYNAKLSDPVKWRFDNQAFAADKTKYAKLWIKIGLKKPLSYLNAWLMTSYGFWYPDTVIDVYSGNTVFTFTYEDSSYFGYEVEQPGVRDSKIPWLDEAYRKLSLEVAQEKVPVISMLYSPGCMFWCFAFVCSYMFYRRKYHVLIPYLLVLLVWLTVILGPTYLPRYVLIFWFGLPLFVAVMLEEERFGLVVK
ncbi:MAG: hypothetical protein IJO97_05025 [Lachnospiraceae bacterium]|nr:hypothetical protein [Lachnospiraceae bacterium]